MREKAMSRAGGIPGDAQTSRTPPETLATKVPTKSPALEASSSNGFTPDWNVPHLNIGQNGQVHLEVPAGYSNAGVAQGHE